MKIIEIKKLNQELSKEALTISKKYPSQVSNV